MFTCEKCRGSTGLPVTLAGGVRTTLCDLCRTKWHVLIRDHGSFRKMVYADAVRANAIQRGHLITEVMDPTFNQAYNLYSEHSKILFDLALEWLGRS